MKKIRSLSKSLLWLHLFVCVVWMCLLRLQDLPIWTIHVFLWSILAIQFTWGFTVGLCVGPSRSKRQSLWWSLLTLFMPLYLVGPIVFIVALYQGPIIALVYLLCFTALLGSETFCGVLLGAKYHATLTKTD